MGWTLWVVLCGFNFVGPTLWVQLCELDFGLMFLSANPNFYSRVGPDEVEIHSPYYPILYLIGNKAL